MLSMQSVRRVSAATVMVAAVAAPAPARADITEYPLNPSATPLARAMAQRSLARPASRLLGAAAELQAGRGLDDRARRLSRAPVTSFAILSTGNARLADDPNDAPDSGSESRGPSIRGARDVVIMRIDLRVPAQGQLPVVQLPLPLGGVPGVRRRPLQRRVHRRARPLRLERRDHGRPDDQGAAQLRRRP